MHNIPNIPGLHLQNAYQQINLYQQNHANRPALTFTNGPASFAGIFASHLHQHNQHSNHGHQQRPVVVANEGQDNEIEVCAQPFYVGEVDHEIEEIGVMAVREVRYVCDEEWEQIMRDNQKFMKAMQNQKIQGIRKVRRVNANNRQRNQKGQFISKKKRVKKQSKQQKNKKQKKQRITKTKP